MIFRNPFIVGYYIQLMGEWEDEILEAIEEIQGGLEEKIEEEQSYYFDLFGYSNVTVQQIYPPTNQSWTVYNNKGDKEEILPPAFIPVSLHNATKGIYGSYGFGVITVAKWI